MAILNIAEKPSVAKSISRVLSASSTTTRGMHKYCPNIHFETVFESRRVKMVFTSVLGHLFELGFEQEGRWKDTDPRDLFDSEIRRQVNPDHAMVVENIKKLALKADMVIIWTDCDREGENIASQIESVVMSVADVEVKRARFMAISSAEIEHALNNLTDINYKEAEAVEARKELDLRIGSAFTRIQTVSYNKGNVLSFGPCQIPTLNFVVQRHYQVQNFIPERFYTLENAVLSKDGLRSVFRWKRSSIFDKNCVVHFYNLMYEGRAVVTDKTVSRREKCRPPPLRTVEFQKVCSSYYKMDSHRIMEVAEKLYNNGYISYPRTETDSFGRGFGFSAIVDKLKDDCKVGDYASSFTLKLPRSGSNNDQAHSPIYPLRSGSGLQGDERKVYEFVARRFLGCVSENARGVETEYTMEISFEKDGKRRSEEFVCKGLNITERNYLDVYVYDRWESSEVGDFEVGAGVENNLEIRDGKTTKPEYLSESDLISLMDKNGIGTDATIHEHIQKIQTRGYAKKEKFRFKPLELGINLIRAYNTIGLPISEPTLRRSLEENLKKVCGGEKNKDALVAEEISEHKDIYDRLVCNINVFTEIIDTPCTDDVNGRPPNDGGGFLGEGTKDGGLEVAGPRPTQRRAARLGTSENATNLRECRKTSAGDVSCSTGKVAETHSGNKRHRNNSEIILTGEKPANPVLCRKQPRVDCGCNQEAKLLETKKGENSGKMFYTCHHFPKKCSFFQWADGQEQAEETLCFCGYEPQKKVASTKANRGREFLSCKKSYKKCKFFRWVDEQ